MPGSLKPQNISDIAWYYEERGGMLVVHEIYDGAGIYLKTDQLSIPWKMVEASLRRVKAKRRSKHIPTTGAK